MNVQHNNTQHYVKHRPLYAADAGAAAVNAACCGTMRESQRKIRFDVACILDVLSV